MKTFCTLLFAFVFSITAFAQAPNNGTTMVPNAPPDIDTGAGVTSVFGRTGTVAAAANDYNFNQLAGNYTLAQGPTIGAGTVLGSVAGGTPAALTQAQLTALINLATASLPGAIPAWPNNTSTYFRGDGTYATLNCAALSNAGAFCTGTNAANLTGTVPSAQLPTATSSALGGVKPDGTTITNSGGAISVTYGTTAGTAAQGNDSRITSPNVGSATGTLAVANGGTGDTGTAWTAYTPTVTCGTGSVTTDTVSGRYKTIGKTVFVQANINISTLGTCLGNLILSAPTGINATGVIYPLSALNSTLSVAVAAAASSAASGIALFFGTAPAANNYFVAGVYEGS